MPGPMMGDTPSGVVALRMWPSRVASFGRVTHVWGGAREPQSGFPDGAGRGGRGWLGGG